MTAEKALGQIDRHLNGLIAALTQVSTRRARRARRVANLVAGKSAAAAAVGGMIMFIHAFGVASTGTMIGTLSGAALSTATLFWIGAIFGGGVATGQIVLVGLTVAVGIGGSLLLQRKFWGRPRAPEQMSDPEVRALYAATQLPNGISTRLADASTPVSQAEIRLFAHEGLLPLCRLLRQHLNPDPLEPEKESECRSFAVNLAIWPRRNLRFHQRRLTRLARKLAKPQRRRSVLRLLSSQSPSSA